MPIPKAINNLSMARNTVAGLPQLSENQPIPPKSAAVTAIAGLIGTFFSSALSYASAQRTNNTNIQLSREAYEQNLAQWYRENAYNSPLAQRQRLEQAGFNAGLMYQNGTGSMVSAQSPQSESPQIENPLPVSGFGSALSDIGGNYLQMKLLQERIRSEQIQNDIREEQRPTMLSNLREQGELLRQKITSETLNQELVKTQNFNERMSELRDEARFSLESDRIDLEYTELEEKIRGMQIDNNFKEVANDIQKRIMSAHAQVAEQEAAQAAKQIAVIDAMNTELAIDAWLIDNFYPLYVKKQTNHSLRGNEYKSEGTMSAYEWLETLSSSERYEMLTEHKHKYGFNNAKITPFSQARQMERYRNLYYKKLNQSRLSPLTQGYFNQSTSSSSAGFKVAGTGFNVN